MSQLIRDRDASLVNDARMLVQQASRTICDVDFSGLIDDEPVILLLSRAATSLRKAHDKIMEGGEE